MRSLALSALLSTACAHPTYETHTDFVEGPSRVSTVEQRGDRVVPIPAPSFVVDHVASAVVTRPNGDAIAITRDDLVPNGDGTYSVRVPLGLSGAVHITMDDGTTIDFALANEGNPRTYCAWEGPLQEVALGTLLELGYGRAAVVEQDSVVLMSEPHDGVALRVELTNLVGSTRVAVRAIPDDAARIEAFYAELERTIALDGCR